MEHKEGSTDSEHLKERSAYSNFKTVIYFFCGGLDLYPSCKTGATH